MKIDIGRFVGQINIIPNLAIYFHNHNWTNHKEENNPWHFHLSLQWIIFYVELQIGKDNGN